MQRDGSEHNGKAVTIPRCSSRELERCSSGELEEVGLVEAEWAFCGRVSRNLLSSILQELDANKH